MLTTRYLFKNLFSVTVFVAVTLALVIWLSQSLRLLELVANSDAPPSLFLKLIALTLPRFLEVILPLALVTGILFTYNKMIMDNELVVMRACGFDQFTLARPALILCSAFMVVLIAITCFISPLSHGEMKKLRREIKAQYSAFLLREGVFNTFSNDLTVYVRQRDAAGDLLGLMIHDRRDTDKPPVTVTAKRGRIFMNGEEPNILVYDGMRQQMDPQNGVVSRLFFSRYTIEIKGLEGEAQERWREASERTLPELLRPDLEDKRDLRFKDAFIVEAHLRLLAPFNALGFTLVSLACILLGPFNRRGQNRKVLAAILIVIGLQAAEMALGNAAKKQPMLLPTLYALTFVPIIVAAFLMHLRGEQWLMALLRKWRRSPVTAAEGATA
ncbi:MAG: LPS export ABC transporter permease LptF [Alphaproteobacteria bacterium]|nr:LPS export ABC transporter permease LptF [Alphaproteobacteria bacterium]